MSDSFTAKSDRSFSLIFLFAGTLFTSASLMFVLQPLFGKLLLPLLGGSPAVWNTCMVFYQSLLFLGYLYAHTLTTRCVQHRQIQIHLAITLISLIALPVALPDNLIPPTESNPTFWLFWTLFLAIGLPFFVVSTTAPLIQKWFANIGHQPVFEPGGRHALAVVRAPVAAFLELAVSVSTLGQSQPPETWGQFREGWQRSPLRARTIRT